MQQKREKGLCFRCDEKWHAGHRCRRRELSMLMSSDEGQTEDGEMAVLEGEEYDGETEEMVEQPEISLNSVLGINNPKTLNLRGKVHDQDVVIMIDPGATHNFVSTTLVEKLKLPVSPTRGFGVTLGTGASVQGQGECKGLLVHIQGIDVVEDFLPLELGNSDIILGIQWLEKLGTMTNNWKTQTLHFSTG